MNAPVDVTGIRIETARLVLRPWRETDLQDLFDYAKTEGVGEMAGWNHHQSMEESRAVLNMFVREKKTLALEHKENGRVIGSLGLELLDPDPVSEALYGREVGYVLGKDYWGRGLMPEAVAAVAEHCFCVLRFDYLTCSHFVWNAQSRSVIEKCGFQYVGETDYETSRNTVEKSRNYILYNPYKER